ncbi:MAG: YdcF family protein [Beijerinckiaceae bacterium]|jgi:uncharacterized SAM-binding protein YcdF (DUF218 family)|nr:YdcF family protein [Beijerinckiaceae bacterium]
MSLIRGQDIAPDAPASAQKALPVARGGRRLRQAAFVLLALGLGAALWLVQDFLTFSRSIATFEPRNPERADGIVVLTGGSQRLSDGLGLLAEGHGRRLLISGVYQKTGRDEIARHARDLRPMLACCVDLGKSARNTIGNAIEARRWAQSNGFTSLLVVTSNYHMPRTVGEFRHALQDMRLIGHPVVSDSVDITRLWSDAGVFRVVGAEYLKFVVSRARHLIESDPETSRLPILVGRQKPVGHLPIERADNP